MCFSNRKPAPPPPPPKPPARPPTRIDPEVRAARSKEKRNSAMRYGRKGTILSGARGDTSTADVYKKTLLGQ